LAVRARIAVAGVTGEVAALGAAGIVGTRQQRAVGEPDLAFGDQLGDPQLHARDPRGQPAQAPVVLRLAGQTGKPARQKPLDQAQKLAVRGDPDRRLADRQRNQLGIAHLALRAGRGIAAPSAKMQAR
jgi:hypothetical protein